VILELLNKDVILHLLYMERRRATGSISLTCEHCWTWDGVISQGLIDIDLDPGICTGICAREANRSRRGRTATCHIDLCAFHVELGTRIAARGMQRDNFMSKEVLPCSMHDGIVNDTKPLFAISLSTAHCWVEAVKPSSYTLNHCSPVTVDCVASGTLAM